MLNLASEEQLNSQKTTKQQEIIKLNDQKKSIEKAWAEGMWDNMRFNHSLNEAEIIEKLYELAASSQRGLVKISSINIGEGVKTEFGFNSSQIGLTINVSNRETMVDFLDTLIKNDTYKFYIETFSIPKDMSQEFSVNIPLIMLYKEFATAKK